MSRVMRSAVAADYPYSDGRPVAESYAQLRAMLYLLTELMTRFEKRSDVYVGGDMFVYDEEGNPAAWWRRMCSWWWGLRSGRRTRD